MLIELDTLINNLHVNVDITITLTVALMGLRKWLLRPYLKAMEDQSKELLKLKAEVERLNVELREILKTLNEKADKDDLKDVRLRLNSLEKTLDNIITKIEGVEIGLQGDQLLTSDEAKKELILRLIREGYNTPKELKAMVPFGNKKLYEILKELEQKGLIRKIKKKRKVVYIAEEAAY